MLRVRCVEGGLGVFVLCLFFVLLFSVWCFATSAVGCAGVCVWCLLCFCLCSGCGL
jgi:hypothetical protein